jgi:general secretion pathway protein K
MMQTVRTSENGVVLIALLWILTALAVIALSFSRESFVEVAAARNVRDLSESYFIARAGVAAAAYRLIERRFTPQVQQLELQGPADPIDVGYLAEPFGRGEYAVEIQDESGKMNLNLVDEVLLRALMPVLGIDKRDGDMIVDSILDWRDVDNAHRLNGAEDDYYQTLNPPYKAKNGRFESVEEMLLLRGVTRDYFYGVGERGADGTRQFRFGLQRCFTVYSAVPQISVNPAPLEVLMSIPGMTGDAAKAIFERRKTKPFLALDEITRTLPVSLPTTVLQYLSIIQTGVYTLTSSAHVSGSKARSVIRAIIMVDPREPSGYRVIYWNENVPRL